MNIAIPCFSDRYFDAPIDERTDEEIEIDALKSGIERRDAQIASLKKSLAMYDWLMSCARKTGIVVTFQGNTMNVVHDTPEPTLNDATHEDTERRVE